MQSRALLGGARPPWKGLGMTTNAAEANYAPLIGANIRRRRTELGYSQERLAVKLGKYRQHIVMWENGHARPSDINLHLLSEVLEVPVGYFWTEPATEAA
jgi:DNA-binding transcriptional regulator YiaG